MLLWPVVETLAGFLTRVTSCSPSPSTMLSTPPRSHAWPPFALAQPIWGVVVETMVTAGRPSLAAVTGVVVVLVAWLALIWPLRSRRTPALH
jgi:hypothetical protein